MKLIAKLAASLMLASFAVACAARWQGGRLYVGPPGTNPVETARPTQPAPPPPAAAATPAPPAPQPAPAAAAPAPVVSQLHKLAGLPQPAELTMAALARLTEAAPEGGDFYVAMHGSDANPGTADQPFATVQRAQLAVRERIAEGLTRDVRVWIRGGFYSLDEPWTFTAEDSGNEQFSITYAAHPGHRVILSGGQRLDLWRKATRSLWAVSLSPPPDASWRLRRLYVNGRSAIRARSPNLFGGNPLGRIEDLNIQEAGASWGIRPSLSVGTWSRTNEVELVMFNHWEVIRKIVDAADPRTRSVQWDGVVPLPIRPRPGVGCYFENDPGMLDQPGEWYYDAPTTTVYYWPRLGDELSQGLIVAPRLSQVLQVLGTPEQPVRNIHFEGLEIAHSNWQPPDYGFHGFQAAFFILSQEEDPDKKRKRDAAPAAIHWEFAERCSFRNGWVTQSGGTGLRLGKGCRDNLIQGNYFYDIAATGIMVGDPRDWRDESTVARGNQILNNVITDVGNVYHGGVGIWVGFAQETRIANNLITDLPYTGISVGWLWDSRPSNCKSNIIEHNRIARVMRWLADGGGIYTLGYQPGTIIRSNHVSQMQFSHFAAGGAVAGIYLDNGSKGFEVTGNVVEDVPLGLWVATNVMDFRWLPNLFPSAKPSGVENYIGPPLSSAEAKDVRAAAGLEPEHRKRMLRN